MKIKKIVTFLILLVIILAIVCFSKRDSSLYSDKKHNNSVGVSKDLENNESSENNSQLTPNNKPVDSEEYVDNNGYNIIKDLFSGNMFSVSSIDKNIFVEILTPNNTINDIKNYLDNKLLEIFNNNKNIKKIAITYDAEDYTITKDNLTIKLDEFLKAIGTNLNSRANILVDKEFKIKLLDLEALVKFTNQNVITVEYYTNFTNKVLESIVTSRYVINVNDNIISVKYNDGSQNIIDTLKGAGIKSTISKYLSNSYFASIDIIGNKKSANATYDDIVNSSEVAWAKKYGDVVADLMGKKSWLSLLNAKNSDLKGKTLKLKINLAKNKIFQEGLYEEYIVKFTD